MTGSDTRFADELTEDELLAAFRSAANEDGYATAREVAAVLKGSRVFADGRMISGGLQRHPLLVHGFDTQRGRPAWRRVNTPEAWAGQRVRHPVAGDGTVTTLSDPNTAKVRWDSGVVGGAWIKDLETI